MEKSPPSSSHRTSHPLVIPVFIPHGGCPHRCLFCNQEATTGSTRTSSFENRAEEAMNRYLKGERPPDRPVEIAFFGGNFLGLAPHLSLELLEEAMAVIRSGRADAIRFSTRPDTVTRQSLSRIAPYPVRLVEIGAQSMDDGVLSRSRRGHTAADTEKAVHLLHEHGLRSGVQMMVGLPGDSDAKSLETASRLKALSPATVRIYPTVVLRDSALHNWYEDGRYAPLSLDEAIHRTGLAAGVFRSQGIPVIRMGLQATTDLDGGKSLVAGPYHPAFGHLVYCERFRRCAASRIAEEGKASSPAVTIRVHPKDISRMRGDRSQSVAWLTRRFNLRELFVKPDPEVPLESLSLDGRPPVSIWQPEEADPS